MRPRSGLALKHGITVLNIPGTIDSDYRGEIGVILINLSDHKFEINNGDRVAQLVFAKHESIEFQTVESLENSPWESRIWEYWNKINDMKIIVPMAGRSRLRPQTFITPKPLIHVAGKSILEQLLSDVIQLIDEPVKEIIFIIGPPIIFDNSIINLLNKLAEKFETKPIIKRQLKPLGTGDAVLFAKEHMQGKAFVIYPDTLVRFKGNSIVY